MSPSVGHSTQITASSTAVIHLCNRKLVLGIAGDGNNDEEASGALHHKAASVATFVRRAIYTLSISNDIDAINRQAYSTAERTAVCSPPGPAAFTT